MKIAVSIVGALVAVAALIGCAHDHDQAQAPVKPSSTKVRSERETIAGQVVLVAEGYRFRPNDEPNNDYRLSRADTSNELANQEIRLRKYYGKALVVKGRKQEEWLADAAVIGQFLKP